MWIDPIRTGDESPNQQQFEISDADDRTAELPASLAGRFLLVFLLKQCKFLIGRMLDCSDPICRSFHGEQNFRQLELNCCGVARLRVLDQENH